MLALILALPAFVAKEAAVPALRLRGGGLVLDTKTLNMAGAIYHASFGVALYADPNAFADSGMSPIKYTADAEGPVGAFTARSFGAMMLGMSSIALFDVESAGATKMFATVLSLFTPILIKNIQEGEPSFKVNMWKFQSLIHIPFAVLMVVKAFGNN
jgi:hypothetical protein